MIEEKSTVRNEMKQKKKKKKKRDTVPRYPLERKTHFGGRKHAGFSRCDWEGYSS
jgi:hypothetical protein